MEKGGRCKKNPPRYCDAPLQRAAGSTTPTFIQLGNVKFRRFVTIFVGKELDIWLENQKKSPMKPQ